MRVLSLDASTKTGWALFVDGKLADSGALTPVKVADFNVNDHETQKKPAYPYNIVDAALTIAREIREFLTRVAVRPDIVVVENTNKGKNRHTQRVLEFMHFCILMMLRELPQKMVYMDTSEWRKIVGLEATKEDKKQNAKLSAAKKAAKKKGVKLDKKALGIRGKINVKHRAVRMVNEKYGKNLKMKDNDQADAILMGEAYCRSHAGT
jgi:hypothetical protein